MLISKSERDVLSEYDNYEIVSYYLGFTPELRKAYSSTFRVDNKPSMIFYERYNRLYFKDLAHGTTGNVIELVSLSTGLTKQKILYDIEKKKLPQSTANITNLVTSKSLPAAEIKPYKTPFNIDDIRYWQEYNISLDVLKHFRVIKAKRVTVSNKGSTYVSYSNINEPIYVYCFGKNKYKIYKPKSDYRFLTNTTMIQGYTQLSFKSDLLVITKSLKDVMCLYTFGIDAIAPQAESTFVSETIYRSLCKKYKKVVVLYDNDLPGIANTMKIRSRIPITFTFIPKCKYAKAKDFSDLYKFYGSGACKDFTQFLRDC
jgi:hypothetical protein